MSYYVKCLKKYADFSGRARRKEAWMFILVQLIISLSFLIINAIISAELEEAIFLEEDTTALIMLSIGSGVIAGIYSLATIIPSIAVAVRRLHDIGKSGAWYFIQLIPVIGSIWLLILMCTDSQSGANQYGENPKQ